MNRRAETDDPLLIAEDILSAKWTLTILRVLGAGPARFSGLRTAIPAVSANVLAERLRDLQEAGILCRTTLPPPADCQVYKLTDIGEAVRPILQAIGQWASRFEKAEPPGDQSGDDDGAPPQRLAASS